MRRTPGIIGPGEARGVVITSIRRGVCPGEGIHCTRSQVKSSQVKNDSAALTSHDSAALSITHRHAAALSGTAVWRETLRGLRALTARSLTRRALKRPTLRPWVNNGGARVVDLS